MDKYFETTRKIHSLTANFTYNALSSIDGVNATRPQATFYLLADFNQYSSALTSASIPTSQRLAESIIQHPYHTAIVGGDSLILERTDFSARIAYVDYDGAKTYENFQNNPPKSASEEEEFVKINAPRVISGIKMIESYFENIKKKTSFRVDEKLNTLKIPN